MESAGTLQHVEESTKSLSLIVWRHVPDTLLAIIVIALVQPNKEPIHARVCVEQAGICGIMVIVVIGGPRHVRVESRRVLLNTPLQTEDDFLVTADEALEGISREANRMDSCFVWNGNNFGGILLRDAAVQEGLAQELRAKLVSLRN